MSDKVSIIIPVYKVEKYLDRCIESVVKQTFQNLEIILVNDGSPDGCPRICENWSKKDNRIKVIHKENGGPSDARNTGIKNATGELISFVDSDDVIATNMIEFLYNMLLYNDADIAVTTMQPFNNTYPAFTKKSKIICGTADEILYEIICKSTNWEACGKLYKKNLFDNGLQFIKGKFYEDLYFTPRVFSIAKSATYCNNKMYGYFQRSNSTMGKTKSVISVDLLVVLQLNIDFIKYQYNIKSNIYKQLFAEFILHPNIKLEDIESYKSYIDNAKFIKLYKRYIRNNWREIKANVYISKKYKVGLFISMYSVLLFNKIFKIVRFLNNKQIIKWSRH